MKAKLLDQIKRHEGLRLAAYKDHLGYLTIGYGRLIDEARNGGISEAEAEHLLHNDLAACERDLESIPGYRDLDDVRQAALINMRFQLGGGGIRAFKKMWAALNVGDYGTAALEALDSRWAKQTPRRAAEVAEQLRTGVFQ
jgi:lysozyme